MNWGKSAAVSLTCLVVLAAPRQVVAAEGKTAKDSLQHALQSLEKNETNEALQAAHRAMIMLTQQDRFHIRTAKMVAGEPEGFGIYNERPEGPFKPGEKVKVYVEPGAFKYGGADDGFEFGFSVDFRLATLDGDILGGQDEFTKLKFNSHRPNTEMFLDLTLNLSGVPTGDYMLKFAVHDLISDEIANFEMPISFLVE